MVRVRGGTRGQQFRPFQITTARPGKTETFPENYRLSTVPFSSFYARGSEALDTLFQRQFHPALTKEPFVSRCAITLSPMQTLFAPVPRVRVPIASMSRRGNAGERSGEKECRGTRSHPRE